VWKYTCAAGEEVRLSFSRYSCLRPERGLLSKTDEVGAPMFCYGSTEGSLSPPRRSIAHVKNRLCGVYCGIDSTMQIVQIVLDKKLLHAADQAAKRTKRNRSALVRDALREHLRRLELRASEERDRQGYSRQPQSDAPGWEAEAAWQEE
jgi:hypothetical protein